MMSSTKPEVFPLRPVTALFMCMVVQSFALGQLLSYAGFLVVHYGLGSRDTAGYTAGFLAAAFMYGRTLSAYPLGLLVDSWGRKPVLYMSLGCIFICSIGFGFSPNYPLALCFRFALGLFNGTLVVVKTMVSEISHSKEHEAKAMSAITMTRQVAMLFAPALGGFLYEKGVFGSETLFPHLLVNLISSALVLVTLVMVFLWVPETAPRLLYQRQCNIEANDEHEVRKSEDTSGGPLHQIAESNPACDQNGVKMTIWTTRVVRIMWIYFALSVVNLGSDEVVNLFAIASKESGGIGWDADELGIMLSCTALLVVPFTVLTFSPVSTWLGLERTNQVCIAFLLPPLLLIPATASMSPAAQWTTVILLLFVTKAASASAFACQGLLLNHSVDKSVRGQVNGVSMGVGSIAKALGPSIAGPLFAWSIDRIRMPMVAFAFLAFCCAVSLLMSFGIPRDQHLIREVKVVFDPSKSKTSAGR